MTNYDKRIGYVIIETATVQHEADTKIISDNGRRVTAEVILQDMNVLNRNKRFYASKEMNPALKADRLIELCSTGNLFGEEGHPLSKEITRQQIIEPSLRCQKIVKFYTEGNDIKAQVRGSNTAYGEAFDLDLRDGDKPSFSLRALGTVNQTSKGAEVENITIITWDRVIYPSHKRAYVQKVIGVTENATIAHGKENVGNQFIVQENDAGLLIPITNNDLIDYIKQESSNLYFFIESFDLMHNTIQLKENGRQVQICSKDGDTFIVNLEDHIQNDIMDYCEKQYLNS